MTSPHATYVGVGGGEVGGGNHDGSRFVVTVEFLFELRDGLVEFANDLAVSLPVCPNRVTRWEKKRGTHQ